MPAFILHKELEKRIKTYAWNPAVLFKKGAGYESLTFAQFLNTAKRIGHFLIQEGVGKKENVALFLENQPNWGCIYFGILFSGCSVVPLDIQLNTDELKNICNDASVKIVFTSKSLLVKINPVENLKMILADDLETKFSELPEDYVFPEAELDDTCSLVYTSGTTAQPKAVMLTHRNFSSNINSVGQLGFITSKDNLISMLPLHHTYAFMVNLLVPLFCGGRITYVETLTSDEVFCCVKEANVTIVAAVPQFFNLLLSGVKKKFKDLTYPKRIFLFLATQIFWLVRKTTNINLAKILFKKIHDNFGEGLRYFASGGARLDPKVAVGILKLGFAIVEGYGLTETSPVASFNLPNKNKVGSVGMAIPGVDIKINNPDKEGVGEIIIKGDNVFKGYYKRKDLTDQAIKNGWFHSGDLGFIDKKGFVYITGRLKEVIVLSSGKNIYPEEIETFYQQSPCVKELCVLETSQGLHALVVPDMDYLSKTKLSNIQGSLSWELDNFSRKLPGFKRLMGFIISTEELPRTRLGKLQRYKIKKIYEAKARSHKERETQSPQIDQDLTLKAGIFNKVVTFLSKELKIQVKLDDHLELDLGIDSLRRVEIGLNLEKSLGIELPDDLLTEVFTVRELIVKLGEFIKDKSTDAVVLSRKDAWGEILSHQPPEQIVKKIRITVNTFDKIFTFFFTKLFYLIFLLFHFLRIKGKNNIPKDGAYILCVNHTSYFDGFIVIGSLPFKAALKTFFLAHTDIFDLPLFKWMVTVARIISIDPSLHLIDAMQASSFVLKYSKFICIFPEGQRMMDGKIGEFKHGIGILIKELNVPCIPVYIKGAYEAWPRYRRLMRPHPITVTFGRSYTKDELKIIGEKSVPQDADEYTIITAGVKKAMIDLSAKKND